MSDLLEDLVDWVNAEVFVTPKDIYRDFVPDLPENAISFVEYDSVLSPYKGNEAALRYIAIQVRNKESNTAKALAKQLFGCFMRPEENFHELPSGRLILSSPKNAPIKVYADTKTTTWGFNVSITTNII